MAKSPLYRPRDPELSNLENAISDLPNEVLPVTAPKLRAHSIATLAEARKTRGSTDGARGPRAMMLAGHASPLDAGAGIFIWDATSTLADDATVTPSTNSVIAVQGVEPGRWRRLSLGGGGVTDGDKGDIIVTIGGTVWTIDPAYTASVLEVTGTAILDFGLTPTTDTTIAVVGQPNILTTSKVRCWFQDDSTALNDAQSHVQAAQAMGVCARSIIAGTGFTIDASTDEGFVEGTFIVHWGYVV